jgi:uncharacterized protein YkwD
VCRTGLWLFFLLILGLSRPAIAADPSAKAVSPSEAAAQILIWINKERAAQGLSLLTADNKLAAVAQEHSADMARRGYFSHFAPTPAVSAPMDRYLAAFGHQQDLLLGENIAYADQPVFALLHQKLLASPKHRANLLNSEFTKIGIGIYSSPDGKIWLTQMFTGPVI